MTPIKFFLPAALVVAACWWAGPATAQSTADKVTPTELLAKQDQLTNKPVVVQGTLSNSGTNYFTDLRVILKDNTDAAAGVIVQPWLPIETRQHQTDGSPPTAKLSDFLGKKVEISRRADRQRSQARRPGEDFTCRVRPHSRLTTGGSAGRRIFSCTRRVTAGP